MRRYSAYCAPVGCSVPSVKAGDVEGVMAFRSGRRQAFDVNDGVMSRISSGQRSNEAPTSARSITASRRMPIDRSAMATPRPAGPAPTIATSRGRVVMRRSLLEGAARLGGPAVGSSDHTLPQTRIVFIFIRDGVRGEAPLDPAGHARAAGTPRPAPTGGAHPLAPSAMASRPLRAPSTCPAERPWRCGGGTAETPAVRGGAARGRSPATGPAGPCRSRVRSRRWWAARCRRRWTGPARRCVRPDDRDQRRSREP
jgi:hypothetical protein